MFSVSLWWLTCWLQQKAELHVSLDSFSTTYFLANVVDFYESCRATKETTYDSTLTDSRWQDPCRHLGCPSWTGLTRQESIICQHLKANQLYFLTCKQKATTSRYKPQEKTGQTEACICFNPVISGMCTRYDIAVKCWRCHRSWSPMSRDMLGRSDSLHVSFWDFTSLRPTSNTTDSAAEHFVCWKPR